MKRVLVILCVCLMLFSLVGCRESAQRFQYTYLDTFDTVTTLVLYAPSQAVADTQAAAIHERLLELHRKFTIYESDSDIVNLQAVNLRHGEAVQVDDDLFALLTFGKDAYDLTDGKVNMALGSVLKLWHEARERAWDNPDTASVPLESALIDAAKHIRIDSVQLNADAQTVCLTDEQTTLDVGAFAKGYAVQRVADYARELGVTSALISVGGNVVAVGDKNGTPFTIGIEDPKQTDSHLLTVDIKDRSVVTSGNYQRYFMVDGVRYHHLIHPNTLYPAGYWDAVTVIGPDSGMADVLSTALFLSSQEEGQAILDAVEGYKAIWVDGNGTVLYSERFEEIS